eukprot:TRINITY_DN300_c0_g1_i4.p1 TRINITY_DN300_c0_g1~~TRINITY_DN300_c0_g1_i4.p1  ORF type:complete len:209 (-),score=51.39 TRINITY_DN300_c0_g1_i4:37-663(-)
MNESNNNNQNDEKRLSFISNSKIKYDCSWDPNNSGSEIEIITPRLVQSIEDYWKNSYAIGEFEFKENTGLYLIKIRIKNYSSGHEVVGVARLSDMDASDENNYKNCYGIATNGYVCYNRLNVDTESNLPLSCSHTIPISNAKDNLIYNMELNTNTGELKIFICNEEGTEIYLSPTTISNVLFPCHPFVVTTKISTQFELLEISLIKQQ